MRIKPHFSLKTENGQNVIVCKEGHLHGFNNTITLSETAAFLWRQLEQGDKSGDQLLNLMLEEYDISTVLALNDIDIFLKTLRQNGILEE